MPIRQLPPVVVNRIAAGEVIERPARRSRNWSRTRSTPARRRIEVILREGGQALIAVADDGSGMTPDELVLAVERHCTSKLPDDDLLDIKRAGLSRRGAAVDRRGQPAAHRLAAGRAPSSAWEIAVEGGVKRTPAPAAASARHAGRGARPVLRDARRGSNS